MPKLFVLVAQEGSCVVITKRYRHDQGRNAIYAVPECANFGYLDLIMAKYRLLVDKVKLARIHIKKRNLANYLNKNGEQLHLRSVHNYLFTTIVVKITNYNRHNQLLY